MKIANLKETRKQNGRIRFFFSPHRETETLFFCPCGGVLLSINLILTPSCWHIISSGRAVLGPYRYLLLLQPYAVQSTKGIQNQGGIGDIPRFFARAPSLLIDVFFRFFFFFTKQKVYTGV